ncbi:hypothetical protein DW355_14895 [Hylemonella gracilis]|uniref:Uncharacterized protein n=1 Tax=Hylemonella gracilis TaxID=80880 RepID=A0A4P6UNK1_9BURK|nr:hypothetical protein [Hylemonella gracilis]QBK05840.1 hypothetical protein DW355_14895 [Hylemonella gracilis]
MSLLGASVENSGTIIANAGRIHLGVGERITLDFDGDGLMRFAVDEALQEQIDGLDTAIHNSGELRAEGGQVVLEGRVARDVFAHVVNNEGVIKAGRIDNSGGVIRLVGFGGSESSVLNSGTLDAAGRDASSTGGQVHVLGERVALTGNALVDASGAQGGGEVLIGGDYQGKNPDIPNAERVFVGSGVRIKADAIERGNGGKVILWADGDTRYFGSISARGGAAGGNGGFAEVSGKQRLAFSGQVDLSAAQGQLGSLLLDPDNLYISDTDPAAGQLELVSGPFEANDHIDDYWVNTATLAAVTGNVTLLAGNDVIFLSDLSMAAQGAADTLTVDAGNAITMNGHGITTDGSVSMTAGAGGVTGIGTSSVGVDFTINSGGAVSQSGAIETLALNITAVGGIVLNAANQVGSFDATNTGAGDIQFTNTATTLTATISQSGGGDVVIDNTGALELGTTTVSDGGDLTLTATGAISQTGALTIAGTTTLAAGANSITLDDTGNDFGGLLTITSGAAVALKDQNALTVMSTSTTGVAVLTAGGDLAVSGDFDDDLTTVTTGTGTTDFGATTVGGILGSQALGR